jgi:glutamate racemase
LLLDHLARLAPWPVDYIDPAPAIARRVDALLGPSDRASPYGFASSPAIFTSGGAPGDALRKALRKFGLSAVPVDAEAFAFSRT